MSTIYDIGILGGGPGGYVAAIRAAQLGLKVCLVEKNHLGGICLNWGCIPTKSLLKSSELFTHIKKAGDFGIVVQGDIQFDLPKAVSRSRAIADQLSRGISHLLKKNKVDVFMGHGTLKKSASSFLIEVTQSDSQKREVQTKSVILATGARSKRLPGLESLGDRVWTAREAMSPTEKPHSLIILGSGAIGVEFASFYAAIGTQVTVVEMAPRILPIEDAEIAAQARKGMEALGIRFMTDSKTSNFRLNEKGQITVDVQEKSGKITSLTADRLLLAVGIEPNTEEFGLKALSVEKDVKGHLKTSGICQTNIPGLYAIGDVAAGPWLAHKASHEGILVAEHLAGKNPSPLDPLKVPGCTYSSPQVASLGLTEEKARALYGNDIHVGRFSFLGNGRALSAGYGEGLIKTIYHAKTGEFLGAHLIGPEVTELIGTFGVAQTAEATDESLIHTIFPHPTLSEMIHESTLSGLNRTIHM